VYLSELVLLFPLVYLSELVLLSQSMVLQSREQLAVEVLVCMRQSKPGGRRK
jgi:hypothetical protein